MNDDRTIEEKLLDYAALKSLDGALSGSERRRALLARDGDNWRVTVLKAGQPIHDAILPEPFDPEAPTGRALWMATVHIVNFVHCKDVERWHPIGDQWTALLVDAEFPPLP